MRLPSVCVLCVAVVAAGEGESPHQHLLNQSSSAALVEQPGHSHADTHTHHEHEHEHEDTNHKILQLHAEEDTTLAARDYRTWLAASGAHTNMVHLRQLIGCDGRRAAGDLAVRRVRDPGGADHAADPLPAPHPVPHRPGRGHAHRGRSAPPPATRIPRQVAAPSPNIVF